MNMVSGNTSGEIDNSILPGRGMQKNYSDSYLILQQFEKYINLFQNTLNDPTSKELGHEVIIR